MIVKKKKKFHIHAPNNIYTLTPLDWRILWSPLSIHRSIHDLLFSLYRLQVLLDCVHFCFVGHWWYEENPYWFWRWLENFWSHNMSSTRLPCGCITMVCTAIFSEMIVETFSKIIFKTLKVKTSILMKKKKHVHLPLMTAPGPWCRLEFLVLKLTQSLKMDHLCFYCKQ